MPHPGTTLKFSLVSRPEDCLLPVFEGLRASIVVCGHTHMQFDRMVGRIQVLNAGSVGMPFGAPGAYWLLFGREIQLRCTPYDLAEATERIRETDYPPPDFRSEIVIPPSENDTLKLFSRWELKSANTSS